MLESQRSITQFYQYVSEGILFYFLLFPFIHISELEVNFWFYTLLILVSFPCFKVASLRNVTIAPFALAVSVVIAAAIFFLGFPISIAILATSVLVWRFLAHEQEPNQGNELIILLSSILFVFVEVMITYEHSLVFALMLQFIIVLFGHLIAHFYQVPQNERKKGKKSLYRGLLLFIFGAIVMILALRPVRWMVESVWLSITGLFLQGVKGFLFTLESMGLDVSNIQPIDEKPMIEINRQVEEGTKENHEKLIADDNQISEVSQVIEWGSIIAIVIIAMTVIFVMNRKRKQSVEMESGALPVHYSLISEKELQEDKGKRSMFWRSKGEGDIRIQFYKFEKFAHKKGYGRKMSESVEEWFNRVQFNFVQTDLYQKVRYGETQLNDREKERFFEEIKQLRTEIYNRTERR
ncbi:hypothetical protein MUO14_04795 [Halobacillus shinanisalinarum]|uniref:DUF4129 domain-containing protein n=1 Tax=Halobacillus shinanisalinarum TaxID=2932258 RepID=A0ABY4H1M8_9BACI|nr:hypothetical protein [Halobacillus shinanisalinarum]UOQ94283.1 hypothetical protein MUO14_04795 [Halobacillus shinanisalinarum]